MNPWQADTTISWRTFTSAVSVPSNDSAAAMLQREFVRTVLDSRIQLMAQNTVLFDGSLFDLAVEFLRDLPKVSQDEKQISPDSQH